MGIRQVEGWVTSGGTAHKTKNEAALAELRYHMLRIIDNPVVIDRLFGADHINEVVAFVQEYADTVED